MELGPGDVPLVAFVAVGVWMEEMSPFGNDCKVYAFNVKTSSP
jgi:hypothetical protein